MRIAETKRLILRCFDFADAKALDRVFGDPEVMRYGDGVRTPQWVRERLRRCIDEEYPTLGFGPWAVIEKRGGAVIGYCGLSREPQRCEAGETELGYRLARAHWGRGYATEATGAVRDYAFGALALAKLIALIDPGNIASIRVAEKIGMCCEREAMLSGYTHPDHVYVISG